MNGKAGQICENSCGGFDERWVFWSLLCRIDVGVFQEEVRDIRKNQLSFEAKIGSFFGGKETCNCEQHVIGGKGFGQGVLNAQLF